MKYITFKEDIKDNNNDLLLNANTKYKVAFEDETVYIVEGLRIPKSCENDVYEIEITEDVKPKETKKKDKVVVDDVEITDTTKE